MQVILSLFTCAALSLIGLSSGHAADFLIDLSPGPGTALNLGSTVYSGDHAVGLAAPNAVGQPASPATGNEIGAGITYNDTSNLLTFDFAYGSGFGFVDLNGALTVAHVHGPSSVNFPAPNTDAGVQFNLGPFHTSSGPLSGRFMGTQVLSAAQETDLFDNELYVNIHSGFAGGGEIRGQLVPVSVPEPGSVAVLSLFAAGATMIRRRRR